MDFFLILAVLLMATAVIGSLTPMVPGALLSITGILVYWWSTGYSSPGPVFLTAFVFTGLVAVLVDYFAGAVAAKAGSASTRTGVAAGAVGLILFFVAGPIGILVGVSTAVFLREYFRTGEGQKSMRAALYATIGALGSGLVQLTLTLSLLIAFLLALAF